MNRRIEEFCRNLTKHCGVRPGDHVLAALSGGADSVALLRLLLDAREKMRLHVSAAHVEHGIRGADSLADMAFAAALCKTLGVPFYAARVDAPGYAKAHGCGLEDAARTLRYEFLRETAQAIGANSIALAHHAGDQAETVLLHAMRGSDVRGLCAMRYRRGMLIRPLLDARREELRAYLSQIGQDFCEDATNTDRRHARNRVRLDILPAMEQAAPGTGDALLRLAKAAQRDEDFFSAQLDALNLPVVALVDGAAMEKRLLVGLHPALRSRMIVRLIARAGLAAQRAQAVEAIGDMLDAQDASVNLSDGGHAAAGKAYLCMTRADAPVADTPLCVPGTTDTPFGRFVVRPAEPGELGDGKTSQRIPAHLLCGASVGMRRTGEKMIPFAKRTPVKLKKLMIDAGIERPMRASVPIVRAKDGEALFAVGLRASAHCASDAQEEQLLIQFLGAWPREQCDKEAGGRKP